MATNNAINGVVKITTYTSSNTWTKDPRSQWIKVYLWGAGQGGGSGRRGASTASSGGGGGCGGGFCFVEGPASIFDTSQTVTIAGTVTGAAAQTVDNTNGNGLSATSIGATTFGNNIQSPSGGAVGGGTTTTSGGGSSANQGFGVAIASTGISSGVNGTNAAPTGPSGVLVSFPTGTAGGSGSGADSVTIRQASAGGAKVKLDGTTTLLAGGTGGIEGGTIGGGTGNDAPAASTAAGIIMGGTGGGGGGGQSAGGVAGNGGNGGVPGAGGGGGGGSLNGTNSGAGGNGARGQIIVIEFLS